LLEYSDVIRSVRYPDDFMNIMFVATIVIKWPRAVTILEILKVEDAMHMIRQRSVLIKFGAGYLRYHLDEVYVCLSNQCFSYAL